MASVTPIKLETTISSNQPPQPNQSADPRVMALYERLRKIKEENLKYRDLNTRFKGLVSTLKQNNMDTLKEERTFFQRALHQAKAQKDSIENDCMTQRELFLKERDKIESEQAGQKEQLNLLNRKISLVSDLLQCPICKMVSASQILLGMCGHSVCRNCVAPKRIKAYLAKTPDGPHAAALTKLQSGKCSQCDHERLVPGIEIFAARALAKETAKNYGIDLQEHVDPKSKMVKEYLEQSNQVYAITESVKGFVKKLLTELTEKELDEGIWIHFKPNCLEITAEAYFKELQSNKKFRVTFSKRSRLMRIQNKSTPASVEPYLPLVISVLDLTGSYKKEPPPPKLKQEQPPEANQPKPEQPPAAK